MKGVLQHNHAGTTQKAVTTQQSKTEKNSYCSAGGAREKKVIDSKFFDEKKGAMCFRCKEWGHKVNECTKPMYRVQQKKPEPYSDAGWSTVQGTVGCSNCRITLDSGADVSLIREDLVRGNAYTGEVACFKGVSQISQRRPMAKVLVRVVEKKFWMKTAVVEELAGDVLLGRDCKEHLYLIREAVDLALKTPNKQVLAVSTRSLARQELEEQRKDQLSNEEVLGCEFDLDDSLFQTETKAKVKKTRAVKRKDRLMAFSKADKEKPDKEETGPAQLAEEQKADETLQQAWEVTEEKGSEFECKNDLLYHRTGKREEELQLAVPTTRRKKLIRLVHIYPMAAHMGRKRTSEKLCRRYWWPGLCQDVKRFIQECVECQRAVPMRKSKAPLRMMPVFSTPFDRLAADIVGPLPLTERKNKYILTIMDCSTWYPEAVLLRRVDAASVADALLQFFCRFGFPKELLTYRGSNFTSTLMEETLERLGVKHVKSSPYHRETNGMIERWH